MSHAHLAPGASRREVDPRNDKNARKNDTSGHAHRDSEKEF